MSDEEALDITREEAADEAFENAELDGLEDFEGWNVDGDYWSRQVYWRGEPEDDDEEDDEDAEIPDTISGSFGVQFEPGTSKIVDTWSQ